ncbi:VCBS repeat-containing protein [Dactylosporangium sp. NPDC051484]|uniref:FG-GAP repeat domain-containing protein n=1 Tax=Dactylosporangium sp. NPDC051484 TaxID=3154942 RepID=UPI00344B44D0
MPWAPRSVSASRIASFYDNGSANTTLWLWQGTGSGFTAPAAAWTSVTNGYDSTKTKPVAGDFNGDGRADIASFYDDPDRTASLWTWQGAAPTGFAAPASVWQSAPDNWKLNLASPL